MIDPTIPDVVLAGHVAAELRVRADVLRRVLTELIERTAPAVSENAEMLRLAREHILFVTETLGECGLTWAIDDEGEKPQ